MVTDKMTTNREWGHYWGLSQDTGCGIISASSHPILLLDKQVYFTIGHTSRFHYDYIKFMTTEVNKRAEDKSKRNKLLDAGLNGSQQ